MKAPNPAAQTAAPMPWRMLRKKTTAERLGWCINTLDSKRDPTSSCYDASFPLPIRLGDNSIAYIEAEILDWLATRERVTVGGAA